MHDLNFKMLFKNVDRYFHLKLKYLLVKLFGWFLIKLNISKSKLQTFNDGIYLMCSNKIQAEILIMADDLTKINKVATVYVENITSLSKVTVIHFKTDKMIHIIIQCCSPISSQLKSNKQYGPISWLLFFVCFTRIDSKN